VLVQTSFDRLWRRWPTVSFSGDPRYLQRIAASVAETADRLDCSTGTVKRQTSSALNTLRADNSTLPKAARFRAQQANQRGPAGASA
jgi:hypothetical protein